MKSQNRMQDTGHRRLITGETWRYRHVIAYTGMLPIASRLESDLRWSRERGYGTSRDFDAETDLGQSLPDTGSHGYEIAYLLVYGDNQSLQRGDWSVGDDTLCAECAEKCALAPGDDAALYPLLGINGEISGNSPAVQRCDRCGAIIHDVESLLLQSWHDAEQAEPESSLYFAGDRERAMADAVEMVSWFRQHPGSWYVRLLDAERFLEDYETGEAWPIETLYYADATRERIERELAAGQATFPTMPEYRPWEPEFWSYPYPCPDDFTLPTIVGSPADLPEPTYREWGFWHRS